MTQQQASWLIPKFASRYGYIITGVLFGVGFVFFDALIDVMIFNQGTLSEQLLHPSRPELLMRLSFLVLACAFGAYAFYASRREQAALEDARDAESRLEVLFDSAAEFIFLIDAEGVILRANKIVFEESGYARSEMIGNHIKTYFTPDSRQVCECNFPGLREHGYNRADIEFVRKDGSIINMECSATAVEDVQGQYNSFLIVQRDVTERLGAARRLEDSERRFRAIFNSTYQFIGLLDPQGTLLEANQTALDFIGCSNHEVVGKRFWETPWWQHSTSLQTRLKDSIAEAAQGKLVRFEGVHVNSTGQKLVIDFSLKPVLDENGKTVMIIPEGRDISERKLAEEKYRQMQQEFAHVMRLSTMGEMATSMAHELNQPLTALTGYCGTALQLARQQTSLPEGYLDILERASEQAHRAGVVIRHLRDFVSKGKNEMTCVALNNLVDGVIDFVDWELRDSGIEVVFHRQSDAHEVFADKVQIEQVLINLVRNSVEAIRESGISQGKVEISSRVAAANMIELRVADNGPGVSSEMAGVLFDPYRTSKEQGMGMGLSISRSIVEAHNGSLWVDKERQQGALFCMQLPGCD
ncbi:PAS domain S-box protein [Gammaproteobacteria bacterium]|nr:PAS domain S-box protein [Gammaproteobacteria bacterium]